MTNYAPDLLSQYHDSLRDYRDLQNSLDTYKKEGRQEEKRQIALNLLKKGLDNNFVQETTQLSLTEIAQIRKEHNL